MQREPWVSFCISTYKRPQVLKDQLLSLLNQTFQDFQIVISDNDPGASAKAVVESFKDNRLLYFHNGDNIGMVKSFNKSIDRATSEYIVMVTDDDPVDQEFLNYFYKIYTSSPNYSVYGGFIRKGLAPNELEIIGGDCFLNEILDHKKTPKILWSSCIMKRDVVLDIGKIPDYDSPHLMDHALIAMVGSVGGGVIINKMYSSLAIHDTNFSKSNIEYYKKGCLGFYETLVSFCSKRNIPYKETNIIGRHLSVWLISTIFYLKKYYTIQKKDLKKLEEINQCVQEMLAFKFMKGVRLKYYFKNIVFNLKKILYLLK